MQSIVEQTYANWECLLVDDGSPDNSPAMCDKWAEKDSRIRVFHKENGGVSTARNLGLDKAEGDFVMFVDSDDCIDVKCFETCIKAMQDNDLDILQFGLKRIGEGKDWVKQPYSPVLPFEEFVKQKHYSGNLGQSIFKTSIIKDLKLRFAEGLKIAEDYLFNCTYLTYCKRCMAIPFVGYYYFFNAGSAVNNIKTKDALEAMKALDMMPQLSPLYEVHAKVNQMNVCLPVILANHDIKASDFEDLYSRCCDKRFQHLYSNEGLKVYGLLKPIVGMNIAYLMGSYVFRLIRFLKHYKWRMSKKLALKKQA